MKRLQKSSEELFSRGKQKLLRTEIFLKEYDEVLNKNILHVFRKSMEETGRPHDHRAIKIIEGEIVRLRLDSLHGQADGIKIYFGNDQVPMYIWFSPDIHSKKIVFKMVFGSKGLEITEHYKLEEISKEFLLDLIHRKHKTNGSLLS